MIFYKWRNLCSKRHSLDSHSERAVLFHRPRLISTDSTQIEQWATGLNDYWPSIQSGLVELPVEINAVAERMHEQCKREDEMINDHLDMLIELIQGYKVGDGLDVLYRTF